MKFDLFLHQIPKINKLPLPGKTVHFEMAPMERVKELSDIDIEKLNPKKAGVMALFYPDTRGETSFILILRKTYKGVHSNQIGFPGGKVEPEDFDMNDTALRETEEEVGVDRSLINIIRPITEAYIPPSNFLVQCFMGYVKNRPVFSPQETEVEALIEVSMQEFLDPFNVIQTTLSTSYASTMEVPAFQLKGHVVWGATAMMLNEIKALIKQV